MFRHLVGLTAALIVGCAVQVDAQTRATSADVAGTVLDQSDAVLPGVTVTARNTETNQVRSATTDVRGQFVIPALPPGTLRRARRARWLRHANP